MERARMSPKLMLGTTLLVVILIPAVAADFIPWLVVPPTGPTRHQLIGGIGIPVGTVEAITSGWVIKAQYYLPSTPDDLRPEQWENWNDSRRELSRRELASVTHLPMAHGYERYEAGNIAIRQESLDASQEPDTGEDFDDGDEGYWTDEADEQAGNEFWSTPSGIDPAQGQAYTAEPGRWNAYKAMEKLSESYGLPGRACVLRSVCEAAEAPFTHTGGIFAELLHIVFTPSSTGEPLSEHRDNEYFRAEQLGRSGAPCEQLFRECAHSLLDIFTGVHDPETGALRLRHDEMQAFLMRK